MTTATSSTTNGMEAEKNKSIKSGTIPGRSTRLFSQQDVSSVEELAGLCSRTATKEEYPLAADVQKSVPIYHLPDISGLDPAQRASLQDEWYRILLTGPGVFVTKGLYKDTTVIDQATKAFYTIIGQEQQAGTSRGDHFAAAGRNDRIWNSFSKHALCDPASFLAYYSNPWLSLIASAWLGPWYRLTAQVNNVRPGSAAQVSHRDYHLGFQSSETCAQFPRAMQIASQLLTLQGAVAHVDVPLKSGPTRLLPFSQMYESGFMAYRQEEFVQYFLENYVELPLEKGDGIFFNPALFHAAGENVSEDINRMANLLQICSAFGKTMETIDTLPLWEQCWEEVVVKFNKEGMSVEMEALLAAMTTPYPFPTNMDNNPPRPGGLTPVGELDIVLKALNEGWSKSKVVEELKHLKEQSQP